MKQTKKDVTIELKLPEFSRKDIDVKIAKDCITIRAHKREDKEIHKKDFYHIEKSSKDFNYYTCVPEINPRKAKIDFKKGVLKIKVPKK